MYRTILVSLLLSAKAESCAPDESNLLQKRGNSQAMTFPEPLSAPLASPKLPEAPVGQAMKIATENLTLPQTCYDHDCDYWAQTGYSCETLQDNYHCDCTGNLCSLDRPECPKTCNGHSCDYWHILYNMRCDEEPVSSCDCSGCACLDVTTSPAVTQITEETPVVPTQGQAAPVPADPATMPEGQAAPVPADPETMPEGQAAPVLADPATMPEGQAAPVPADPATIPEGQAVPVPADPATMPGAAPAPLNPETMPEEGSKCEMCGLQDCNYWVQIENFNCEHLKDDYGCSCAGCSECQASSGVQVPIAPAAAPAAVPATVPAAVPEAEVVATAVPTAMPTAAPVPEVLPTAAPGNATVAPTAAPLPEAPTSAPGNETEALCEMCDGASCDDWVGSGLFTCDYLYTKRGCSCHNCKLCEATTLAPEVIPVPEAPAEVCGSCFGQPCEHWLSENTFTCEQLKIAGCCAACPSCQETTVPASTTLAVVTAAPPAGCPVCPGISMSCDQAARDRDYSCKFIESSGWGCDCSSCECPLDHQVCPETCGGKHTCDYWLGRGMTYDELETTYGCVCNGCPGYS